MNLTPAQAWLAFCGLLAIALLQFGGPRARRVAPFVGLSAQPAWIIHALDTGAAGVLVITLAYTVLWAIGCVKSLHKGVRDDDLG